MGKQDRYTAFLFDNPVEKQAELDRLSEEYIFAAGYCRLSQEHEDNCSIESQTMIIRDYVDAHPEIKLTKIYTDNGVTGTQFDRPGWNALLKDIVEGRIGCVIVKDLSRFARNYMEAGYYLEQFFPDMGIRFIAVTDEFDNADERDSLSVNIRNIINDFYARDISVKIKSAKRALMKAGQNFRKAPYGYRLVKTKRRGKKAEYKMEVEEGSSGMVVTMFDWADAGVMTAEIAERLTLMGVVKPANYQGEVLGENQESWTASDVAAILQNEGYTGDYVGGKTETTMHRVAQKDEKDWIRIAGHHDAIVSAEQFKRVQDRLAVRKRAKHVNETPDWISDLQTLFVCEACGKPVGYKKRKGLFTCQRHTSSTRSTSLTGSTSHTSATRSTSNTRANAPIKLMKPPSVKEDAVREAVEAQYDAFAKAMRGFNPDEEPEMKQANRRVEQAKKRRDEAVKENDNAYLAYSRKEMDQMTYLTIREGLVEKVKRTETALERELQARSEIRTKLSVIEEARRGRTLAEIAEKVVLKTDGTVKVVFKGQDIVERRMK